MKKASSIADEKASEKSSEKSGEKNGEKNSEKNSSAEYIHTSLYRKHRPKGWSEVSGQSHIVSILEAEARKEYPSHALLFAGSRGTGKTTLARIFAKEIGTKPEDIYEIDAASNTSVEDIRVLNEAIYALPMNSKFKVYILDEVHMLSKSAFNAFLKTLEEPPKHVIFILATTELHKIPETIISRCQVFHLKKPNIETLRDVIEAVAKKEGVQIEQSGLDMIAHFGNGSFRDTLSTLQTVIGIAKGSGKVGVGSAASGASGKASTSLGGASAKISGEEIEKILGAPNHIMIADFVSGAIEKGDLQSCLEILKTVHTSDMDARLFTDLLIHEFRNYLLQTAQGGTGGAGSAVTDKQRKSVQILELLLTAKGELGKTHISILPLELALFKFFGVK